MASLVCVIFSADVMTVLMDRAEAPNAYVAEKAETAGKKAKTREAGGRAGFVLLFVVGAKGFEPSTL
jgi:hypothetical protein